MGEVLFFNSDTALYVNIIEEDSDYIIGDVINGKWRLKYDKNNHIVKNSRNTIFNQKITKRVSTHNYNGPMDYNSVIEWARKELN